MQIAHAEQQPARRGWRLKCTSAPRSLQVTADISGDTNDGPVLRVSGSSVEFAGYLAAVKDEEDMELSSVPTTGGRPLQVCTMVSVVSQYHAVSPL